MKSLKTENLGYILQRLLTSSEEMSKDIEPENLSNLQDIENIYLVLGLHQNEKKRLKFISQLSIGQVYQFLDRHLIAI